MNVTPSPFQHYDKQLLLVGLRRARKLGLSQHDAEDVVGEALVRLLQLDAKTPLFGGADGRRKCLSDIVWKVVHESYRSKCRLRTVSLPADKGDVFEAPARLDGSPMEGYREYELDPEPEFEGKAELARLRRDLRTFLAGLSADPQIAADICATRLSPATLPDIVRAEMPGAPGADIEKARNTRQMRLKRWIDRHLPQLQEWSKERKLPIIWLKPPATRREVSGGSVFGPGKRRPLPA